mgnify:CR=1 FL=1
MLTTGLFFAAVCCGRMVRESDWRDGGTADGQYLAGMLGFAGVVWAMIRINQ